MEKYKSPSQRIYSLSFIKKNELSLEGEYEKVISISNKRQEEYKNFCKESIDSDTRRLNQITARNKTICQLQDKLEADNTIINQHISRINDLRVELNDTTARYEKIKSDFESEHNDVITATRETEKVKDLYNIIKKDYKDLRIEHEMLEEFNKIIRKTIKARNAMIVVLTIVYFVGLMACAWLK